MKLYLGICSLALAFASCQGNEDKTKQTDAMQPAENAAAKSHTLDDGHYCYFLTEGLQNQDTTKVHFIIDGDAVSGDMKWLPAEKDQREGTLNGKIDGEKVDVIWRYMQEGMQDTLRLQFNLSAGMVLTQKPLKVNADNQRQVTDESADYSTKYAAVDCK